MTEFEELKQLAEEDLWVFAQLVNPERLYGDIHREVYHFLQKEADAALLLLPRGHMKSHCIAVWCAWWITKNPETSILYISSTAELAEAQLYDVKNILTSDKYSMYWPDMVNSEEGKRETWNNGAFSVDHPKRKLEGIRDKTCLAAGLSKTITGLHADVIVPDDIVAPDNAYTKEGRRKVAAAVSQMASILNTGGMIKACGTRYHPDDEYSKWLEQVVPTYNEQDEVTGDRNLYNVLEKVVEINGKFLWPRAYRDDGKGFGFDRRELDKISVKYTDRTQFHAQYYNDPNDPESNRLDYSRFQYYDKSRLKQQAGHWYLQEERLNVYAGVDFAYSLASTADWTAVVVIGIDSASNIYILDIDRFKTNKISEYYSHIIQLQHTWDFRKLRAEISVAQVVIVQEIKKLFKDNGVFMAVDEHRPTRNEGNKAERIEAALGYRYDAMKVWHYKGGHTPALEEELVLARPAHDDIKDCLASVVEIATPPRQRTHTARSQGSGINFNSRFGGVQRG